jgi:hypothetical protein
MAEWKNLVSMATSALKCDCDFLNEVFILKHEFRT